MGSSYSKFRKALQSGSEVEAVQLYVKSSDLRERLHPNNSYGESFADNAPIHYAAKYAMKSLLRDFLSRGGNPNKANAYGETALHLLMTTSLGSVNSIDQHRLECLDILLKWRGEASGGLSEELIINAKDKNDNSSLHRAAASGLLLCVQCLVRHGVSLFHLNAASQTACEVAQLSQKVYVATYLESQMVFGRDDSFQVEELPKERIFLVENEYSGMCAQDLQEAKDQLIVQSSEMLQVPLFTAEALLRSHAWSQEDLLEAYMSDPITACESAGVKYHSNLASLDSLCLGSVERPMFSAGAAPVCGICAEELHPDDHMVQIPCLHTFCVTCWGRYLALKIQDGEVQNIQCPGSNCSKLVPVETIERLVPRNLSMKYLQFDIKAFVETNPLLKWCPFPACGRAVKLPNNSEIISAGSAERFVKTVDCGNTHYFCWCCGDEAHEPCSCDQWQTWKNKVRELAPKKGLAEAPETENIANTLWLVSNSKQCPKCKVNIQKNEGCNHMTCSKCKHEFCWMCTEPWSIHSSETGGYFRCNRYKEDDAKELEERIGKTQLEFDKIQALNKFLHYYSRSCNHESSFKMESSLMEKMNEKVEHLERTASEIGGFLLKVDASFLLAGMKQLLLSRQILKASYPYGYYLENERGQRTIFEFMQDDVEQTTEQLSHMIARPYWTTPKSLIIATTEKLIRQRRNFLTAIRRGLVPKEEFSNMNRQAPPGKRRRSPSGSQSAARSASPPGFLSVYNELRRLQRLAAPRVSGSDSDSENSADDLFSWINTLHRELETTAGASSSIPERVSSDRSLVAIDRGNQDFSSGSDSSFASEADVIMSDGGSTEVEGAMDEAGPSRRQRSVMKPGGQSSSRLLAVAQYDYVAESLEEVNLETGDTVEVLRKRSDGWWRVRRGDQTGFAPASFLLVVDNAVDDAEQLVEATLPRQSELDEGLVLVELPDNARVASRGTAATGGAASTTGGEHGRHQKRMRSSRGSAGRVSLFHVMDEESPATSSIEFDLPESPSTVLSQYFASDGKSRNPFIHRSSSAPAKNLGARSSLWNSQGSSSASRNAPRILVAVNALEGARLPLDERGSTHEDARADMFGLRIAPNDEAMPTDTRVFAEESGSGASLSLIVRDRVGTSASDRCVSSRNGASDFSMSTSTEDREVVDNIAALEEDAEEDERFDVRSCVLPSRLRHLPHEE